MNQINFLSDAFLREQGRRVRMFREAMLLLIVLMTMAAWSMAQWRHTQSLTSLLTQKQEETAELQVQVAQIQQLQAQHAELSRQIQMRHDLGLSIEFSQVIATLSQLMPETLTVTELTMTAPRLTPRVKESDPAKQTAKQPVIEAQFLRIELTGISPTDLDVANFVDRLTMHKLFSTVKVPYSKSTRIGSVMGRKFRVEMEVPLDRIYVRQQAASSEKQEAEHAG